MTHHTAFLELASRWIDTPLAPSDRERLSAHLAECPSCARTASALRTDAQAFAELPRIVLPERRGAAILAAARTPSGIVHPMRIIAVVVLLGLLLVGALGAGARLLQNIDDLTVVPPAPSLAAPSPILAVTAAPSGLASANPIGPAPATASASAAPSPSQAPAWIQMGSFPVDAVMIRNAVGFAGGYAAITSGGSSVWISADGVSWRSANLPFTVKKSAYGQTMGIDVSAIASDGQQLIVVGGYFHEPCKKPSQDTGGGYDCPTAPIAWTSLDGKTWQSAYPGPMPTVSAGHPQGAELVKVWHVPTGGWDAAAAYWEGEGLFGTGLMHSPDGITWSALAAAPSGPSEAIVGPTPLEGIAADDGTRLIWENWQAFSDGNPAGWSTTVASSPDGGSWTTVGGFPGQGSVVSAGIAPAAGDGVWLLAGSAGATADVAGHASVWRGSLTGRWSEVQLPVPDRAASSMARRVLRTTWGVLALGSYSTTNDAGEVMTYQLTWTSPDGDAWTLLTAGTDPILNDAGALADGSAGVITLVGYLTDQDAVTRVLALR